MKVFYLGRPSRRTRPQPAIEGDVLELLSNNWDDYGYKTTFPVTCRINGEDVQLDPVRLLVNGHHTSSDYLDRLLEKGWDGKFPIPTTDYISTPSDVTFYEQFVGTLGAEGAVAVATLLRDASYLVHVAEDPAAKALVESEGFRNSLQRERGSVKAFIDGWRVLERQAMAVLDLGFKFEDVCNKISTLNLRYNSDSLLPHDINVLIGPNGSGKSRVLHQIVSDWISPSETAGTGFEEKPNLSQIVVVSYSPFERFPVDLSGIRLQDTKAYRYFGFRGRSSSDGKIPGKIRLSHEFPKRNAAHALVSCLADDKRYKAITDWARKVHTVEQVLRTAIEFDYATVQVSSRAEPEIFYTGSHFVDTLFIDISDRRAVRRYIPIMSDRVNFLDADNLIKYLEPDAGVTFFRGDQVIELSSGQRLFAYIVINVLGAIRRNSLLLIDEPELFLHPTLEIQFVEMLKTILSRFNSKALLATHSVVTVREVPADCVHVFEKTDEGFFLKHPPFQTFGGDVQRISSYVFGDRSISKPFEDWIRIQLKELGSAENLINTLGKELNEELIVQIQAMERDQW